MVKQKRDIYTASNGATYERLPWKGLHVYRRTGDHCPHCAVSLASHEAIGCALGELL